ncbi:hypothetical protein [Nocardia aurea]|uniref:hypothetical protein n=1 Tax=Nocardia aurea TaxID=2144174 RepID=UPI001300A06D|nr:hypothetical protein [Nocardia aurea]
MTLRAVHSDQQALAAELESLRVRGIEGVFDDVDREPLKLDVLFGLIGSEESELWGGSDIQRMEAICKTIRRAIGRLSDSGLQSGLEKSSITWRTAALIMFDLVNFKTETRIKLDRYEEGQRHAKLTKYVREASGFVGNEQAFKKVNRRMRDEMAAYLLSDGDDSEGFSEDAEAVSETSTATHSSDSSSANSPHEQASVVIHANSIDRSIQGPSATMNFFEFGKQ